MSMIEATFDNNPIRRRTGFSLAPIVTWESNQNNLPAITFCITSGKESETSATQTIDGDSADGKRVIHAIPSPRLVFQVGRK